jgi:hypothetical protein
MGALLVPTAFAAIGFAIIEPNATLSFYMWLGIPSIILLIFWNLLADQHRAGQNKTEAWMNAILEVFNISSVGANKITLRKVWSPRSIRVQTLRWSLVPVMGIYWVALGLWR